MNDPVINFKYSVSLEVEGIPSFIVPFSATTDIVAGQMTTKLTIPEAIIKKAYAQIVNKERNANAQYDNKAAMQFFVKEIDLPTNDDALVKLRNAYFEELKKLEARPEGCTNCAKGALMRKYYPLIEGFYKDVSSTPIVNAINIKDNGTEK